MARPKRHLKKEQPQSSVSRELTTRRVEAAVESDQQIDDEVVAFIKERPLLVAMAERCRQLVSEAANLPEASIERKKLERRFRKLEAYAGPHFYNMPRARQDDVVLKFAQSLIEGVFRFRGEQVRSWDDVKELTDQFAKRIRKRPVGNPVAYRPAILEALEKKTADETCTWNQIWRDKFMALNISFEDFMRQVQLLKKLLLKEGILTPPQQSSK